MVRSAGILRELDTLYIQDCAFQTLGTAKLDV
jgi:hypothetical protein